MIFERPYRLLRLSPSQPAREWRRRKTRLPRLEPLGLVREPETSKAAFRAGQAYKPYRERGGKKHSPSPDFSMGAHALLAGHALLTRDPRRHREYFPKSKVIAPS